MAFSNAHVGERIGDGIDECPELGVGYLFAGGGVDEGDFAVVRAGRDKRRRIEGLVWGKWDWAAFAVEDFGGLAESSSWINFAAGHRHGLVGKWILFFCERVK